MPPRGRGLWRRMLLVVVVSRTLKPEDGQKEKGVWRARAKGKRGREKGRRAERRQRKPQRTLTNCHLQCNTRSVRTIIQRDAGIADASEENPYTERKMPGPRLN